MRAPDLLFHGGAPNLTVGALLDHTQSRRFHEGCPDCEAQRAGHVGPSGDPLTPEGWVYASADRQYARYYASLYGRGWLYRVRLVDPEPSAEDHFPSWRAREAVVVSVLERAVLLTMRERRRLFKRWSDADRAHDRWPAAPPDQVTPCATCGDRRYVGSIVTNDRRPCPSCTPPDPTP